MIDENLLIEKIHKYFVKKIEEDDSDYIDNNHLKLNKEICGIIKEQTKIEKCGDCSRRKFYQQGYEAGKNANKWIFVDDKLPEVEGNYLTCDKYGNIHIFYYHNSMKYPFGIGENHSQYYPVIAWMDIPAVYRKKAK